MMPFASRQGEGNARAYCIGLGLDPDEIVAGYDHRRAGIGERIKMARWRWYVGVGPEAARGTF